MAQCVEHGIRRFRWIFVLTIATLMVITSFLNDSTHAQIESNMLGRATVGETAASRTAPIVVDGTPVFEINSTGQDAAVSRANQIHQKLHQELQEPKLAEIFIVQKDNLVYLQSLHTGERLVSVTSADVDAGSEADGTSLKENLFFKANEWGNQLEEALRKGQLERRPVYMRKAVWYSIIVLIGAIAVHVLLHFVGKIGGRWLKRCLENSLHGWITWERSLQLFWQLGLIGIQIGLWVTVIYYVTDIFPQARSWRYQLTTSQVIDLGSRNFSVLDLFLFLLSAIALWLVVVIITRLFRFYVLNQTNIEQQAQDILGVLLQYALAFIGGLILLQAWDVDISSLTLIASVLGVGLGFGVQNITNNFISGFVITLERPIQTGDFINVGELVGTVEQVGARSTQIRTLDQVTIIVPNSRFLENEVINWSHGDPVSRLHLPVGVAYGSDIAKVKIALLEAVRRHPEVLIRPKPEVWFQGFGESCLKFDVLVWTGEPRNQFRVKSDLYYEVEASLRRYSISIPFPQRDLHLRSPQLDDLLAVVQQQWGDVPSQPSTNRHSSRGHATQSDASDPLTTKSLSSSYRIVPPVQKVDHTVLPGNEDNDIDNRKDIHIDIGKDIDTKQETSVISSKQTHALEFLADIDFEYLADMMQGEGGVPVSDRHDRSNGFSSCFTGTDAIGWLVENRDFSREESLVICQGLLQQGLIKSVIDEPVFKDGYYFYRFYRDDQILSRNDEGDERNPHSSVSVLESESTDDLQPNGS